MKRTPRPAAKRRTAAAPLPPEEKAGESLFEKYRGLCAKYQHAIEQLTARNEAQHRHFLLASWALRFSTSAIAVIAQGKIMASNRPFLELVRLSPSSGRWQVLASHGKVPGSHFSLREVIIQAATRLLARSHVRPQVIRCKSLGSGQVLELRFERTLGLDGLPMMVALAHDITERLRGEAELAQARAALIQQERLRAIGELASGVAHDLNNTLNSMSLRLTLLDRDPVCKGAQAANIDALVRIVSDATAMVGRLQDFARQRHDRPTESVDLVQVVHEAMEMARTEIEQKTCAQGTTIRFVTDLPRGIVVPGIAPELRHVFINLFLNARDAMPKGGAIRVRARTTQSHAQVMVEDEGTGIAEENVPKIFDPFFTTKGRRGTGLGLSMAYGVMTRLGGSIQAKNRPEGGALFTLAFPLVEQLGTSQHPCAERADPAEPAAPTRQLLLIDDEPDNLEATKEVLEAQGQHVETAHCGPAALDRFRRGERFDLVLCDVGMPEMSGWQVAREIRRLAPQTRIYMLTGWAKEISQDHVHRVWVNGILAKPLNLARLNDLLREEPQPTVQD